MYTCVYIYVYIYIHIRICVIMLVVPNDPHHISMARGGTVKCSVHLHPPKSCDLTSNPSGT